MNLDFDLNLKTSIISYSEKRKEISMVSLLQAFSSAHLWLINPIFLHLVHKKQSSNLFLLPKRFCVQLSHAFTRYFATKLKKEVKIL